MSPSELTRFLWKRFGHVRSVEHFRNVLIPYLNSTTCPPHALQEVISGDEQKLWANIWEALLYWHFSRLPEISVGGSRVGKTGQMGPDFKLGYGDTTIWVEAIVPKPSGIPQEWLESPVKGRRPKAKTKPFDAVLLRWTAAFKEKQEVYSKYRERGIVATTDCTIIAINSCMLSVFAFEDYGVSRLPTVVEVVLPIGALAVPISPEGKIAGEAIRVPRFEIRNRNDAAIATDHFLNPEFAGISAVMGSLKRDLMGENLQLSLVHNPLASAPLPRKVLGVDREFVVDLQEDSFTLRRI